MNEQASPAVTEAILGAVDNQLRDLNPPEAKETYDRLIADDYSAEEARRLIAVALSSEMFDILKHKKAYSRERYTRLLRKLPQMPWE